MRAKPHALTNAALAYDLAPRQGFGEPLRAGVGDAGLADVQHLQPVRVARTSTAASVICVCRSSSRVRFFSSRRWSAPRR